MNLSEKTLSEEIIYKGDYLTFTKVKVQLMVMKLTEILLNTLVLVE